MNSEEDQIPEEFQEFVEQKMEERKQEIKKEAREEARREVTQKSGDKSTITIENSEKNNFSRRKFLKTLGMGAGGLALSSTAAANWINLTSSSDSDSGGINIPEPGGTEFSDSVWDGTKNIPGSSSDLYKVNIFASGAHASHSGVFIDGVSEGVDSTSGGGVSFSAIVPGGTSIGTGQNASAFYTGYEVTSQVNKESVIIGLTAGQSTTVPSGETWYGTIVASEDVSYSWLSIDGTAVNVENPVMLADDVILESGTSIDTGSNVSIFFIGVKL